MNIEYRCTHLRYTIADRRSLRHSIAARGGPEILLCSNVDILINRMGYQPCIVSCRGSIRWLRGTVWWFGSTVWGFWCSIWGFRSGRSRGLVAGPSSPSFVPLDSSKQVKTWLWPSSSTEEVEQSVLSLLIVISWNSWDGISNWNNLKKFK